MELCCAPHQAAHPTAEEAWLVVMAPVYVFAGRATLVTGFKLCLAGTSNDKVPAGHGQQEQNETNISVGAVKMHAVLGGSIQ